MAMVGVDSGSLYRRTQPKSSGLVLGRRPLGAVLHSSSEPDELSQWLCHDDSTINIVLLLLYLLFNYHVTVGVTFRPILYLSCCYRRQNTLLRSKADMYVLSYKISCCYKREETKWTNFTLGIHNVKHQ